LGDPERRFGFPGSVLLVPLALGLGNRSEKEIAAVFEDNAKQLHELCALVSAERDREKMRQLTEEIHRLLEELMKKEFKKEWLRLYS
jgi:hypothetical protein